MPDYSARLLGREDRISVRDLRGEVLLLNTWATWCDPCREEMPDFDALQDRYRGDGLRVIGVNIDQGRSDAAVTRFIERSRIGFEIWRDPANRFADRFRVLGPPETFLVERDGTIAFHWRGQMNPDDPANATRIRQALGLDGGAATASAAGVFASMGLLVAFGAGLLSVLSPCVLPLIPSYASVVAGVTMRHNRSTAPTAAALEPVLVRGAAPATPGAAGAGAGLERVAGPVADRGVALRAGLSFVAGFSTVFMALGLLVNRLGAALGDNRHWLARIGGAVLIVLGLHLLGVLRIRAAEKESRLLPMSGRAGYAGAFLVGVAFAAGWSPCIGPVLSGILTMAAAGGSTLQAATLLAAYSAGLALPFLLAALALDRFLAWSARLRHSWLPMAERVSGALVLAVGLLLLTGVFSRMAAWLS